MLTSDRLIISKSVKRMLGWPLHTWENLMLFSLGAAAFAAVLVIISTWAIVHLQRKDARESAEKIATLNSQASAAGERIAQLNNEASRLQADNLALQSVMAARHVGVFGINGRPQAERWFSELEQFPQTKLLIQVIPGDAEAQNLANEIAIAVQRRAGWRVEFIDEQRSHLSLRMHEGVEIFSPSLRQAFDPKDPKHVENSKIAGAGAALARALTFAGLGVGSYAIERAGLAEYSDHPPNIPWFDPPLHGIFLAIDSRPISLTMEWIKMGRPDALGNKASP